jgi:6-phosphogluconolactonase
MKLRIEKDKEQLCLNLAAWIDGYISRTLEKHDLFSFVLSGGNTPKKLYEVLADKHANTVDWARVLFFWGDERVVPYSDVRSNARMADESLLSKINVPTQNIIRMDTAIDPFRSAADYESRLHECFANKEAGFDLVLLGLGDNGHTLSLFPGYGLTQEKTDWVHAYYLKEQQMHRITLMPALVNRSREIAWLVTGEDKAPAVQSVIEGTRDPDRWPAQSIKPIAGESTWWLDSAAAGQLHNI